MLTEDAVGIDLGTTNSAVAWIDEKGHSVMIRSAEGELLTPSVVLFDDNETIVGKSARAASTVHPDQVAQWVKRDMGSKVYHQPIRGEYFPPEVIQACILRKLKDDIVAALTNPGHSVITVPAYFDEPRRKGTADAGEMAGLNVLDIVNEPTAAALAFGERLGFLSESGTTAREMTVLVYDLGGGTFDVTLLHMAPGNIQTLATDGDVRLGGHDWDLRLVDFVAERFIESGGPDPRQDPCGFGRLYTAVEEAKHTLSARNRAAVRLDHAGHSFSLNVTREQFADMTSDLLERTVYTTRQVITDAGISWDRISRVLLVGGSTRMPMVAEKLERMSGIRPDRTVNPDEAVARGAAIYARFLLNRRAGRQTGFEVSNVNSHSLGIEGIDPETMRKTKVTLIPRNTPLPATFTDRFTTKRDGQQSIVVQVLEGESSRPEDCTQIGRTVVRGLPPNLPQGTPIDVKFSYQSNGRLEVSTRIPGTGQESCLTIERNSGLSEETIADWQGPIASAASFDEMAALIVSGLDPETVSTRPVNAAPPAPTEPLAPPPPPPPSETVQLQPSAGGPDFVDDDKAHFPARGRSSNLQFWVFLAGWILSSVVGIGLGYLLVLWLFPEIDWPRPW
jgi:molecular chaperone DnaK